MFANKSLEKVGTLADQAVHSAEHAIQTTQRVANEALDSLADSSRQLRDKARHASHSTVNYVRDEPVKSLLIAAATGAALMALVTLVNQSRQRH
jgi:ElaB/YqjD/DUF883 family membrane-anchored ribosome-binding protein